VRGFAREFLAPLLVVEAIKTKTDTGGLIFMSGDCGRQGEYDSS
jgi:hypothetical protein